jgi:hypothetical protein
LSSFGDSPNTSFYHLADRLSRLDYVNPTYSLVSFRTIVGLSPISPDLSALTESILNPVNSYRWLFLIHVLTTRKLTTDTELEEAKLTFVCKADHDVLSKVDP